MLFTHDRGMVCMKPIELTAFRRFRSVAKALLWGKSCNDRIQITLSYLPFSSGKIYGHSPSATHRDT